MPGFHIRQDFLIIVPLYTFIPFSGSPVEVVQDADRALVVFITSRKVDEPLVLALYAALFMPQLLRLGLEGFRKSRSQPLGVKSHVKEHRRRLVKACLVDRVSGQRPSFVHHYEWLHGIGLHVSISFIIYIRDLDSCQVHLASFKNLPGAFQVFMADSGPQLLLPA